MSSEITYPWFFFYRIGRLSFVVFLPTLIAILFFYRSSFKTSLTSQIEVQMVQSLKESEAILKKSNLEWSAWCKSLDQKDVRYLISKKNGQVLCGTVTKSENPEIEASINISDDLIFKKAIPLSSIKSTINNFDGIIFQKIVPLAFLSWVLFLILFYIATKPLGGILSKVEQFKIDIPFNKNLQLLYKKNEWSRIEEALNEADSQLKKQIVKVRTENEKIAAILESIYDNIIAIDPYETILFYNSNFKFNFIKEKANELIPKIWHKFSDEKVLEAFRSVLKDGESVSLRGLKGLSYKKPDHFFDLKITPLKNVEGKIDGALGVFYDVTEFKLTEQMRVDFVANVSHEIRTPLTSIKGYTQVLEAHKNKINPELHGFLDKIVANTERMILLFNDLLSLSVIESKNIMKLEEVNVESLIESASENIKTNYPKKLAELDLDLQLESIHCDKRLMEQVVSNLLDNACKYSQHEIKIRISSYRREQKAYLEVMDNGPGIPKEHLQRIFERFYRVDSSREASRGTGLGLSIVKHIIAKHGGRIWAESEEGKGTTFIIELPFV